MSAPSTSAELLDLKMMPAWVNEPPRTKDYADYKGEDERSFQRENHRPERGREQRSRLPKSRDQRDRGKRPEQRRPERREDEHRPRPATPALPQVEVRFLPHLAAFESVAHQIKSSSVTYSVFALARLFLDNPKRYDVRLTAPEGTPLHQLGEGGAVAADQRLLENNAFATAKDDFYNIEQTQTEPIKGNFSNVARCRLSGILLGPTNHHSYQPQLRNLYEQRFSRRMSFQDYQRQIEIVSDPAVVEQWKEQARSVTTYTTKLEESPTTFSSASEAERHFRQTHLPALLRSSQEVTISGVVSRSLQDSGLGRAIEDAWAAEIRSPSKMMQELASGLREAGLNIFRHRRGMLFVSPIRIRAFGHDRSSVSASINGILEKLTETPGIKRKELAEKMTSAGAEPPDAERAKMSLISDLHWLISEGYVIEFNDGTLDLPRPKSPKPAGPAASEEPLSTAPQNQLSRGAQLESTTNEVQQPRKEMNVSASAPFDDPIGMSLEQSVEPIRTASDEGNIEAAPATDETEAPGSEQLDQALPTTLEEGAVPSPS